MAIAAWVLSLLLSAQPNTEGRDPPVRLVPGIGQPFSGEGFFGADASGRDSGAAAAPAAKLPGSSPSPKEGRPGAPSAPGNMGLVPGSTGSATPIGFAPGGTGSPSPGVGSFPGGAASAPAGMGSPAAGSGAGARNAGAAPSSLGSVAGSGGASGSSATPPQSAAGRGLPSAILAELLTLPSPSAITGRPITLLEALSAARDVGRQGEVVHAYWRLTEAMGKYRAAWDALARLPPQVRPEDAPMLRAAQAAAQAAVQVAAAGALRAQHDLGEAAMLSVPTPPLPADPPHVGAYRTGFDEVYAMRGVVPRARLIHRLLPVRRQAIEARAAAVQAADDALLALAEAYAAGRADFPAVLAALEHWTSQRQAFLSAVCQYNHDIADYALAVAGPVIPSHSLVSMLILPAGRSSPASTPPASSGGQGRAPGHDASSGGGPGSAVIPATALEPAVDSRLSQPGNSSGQSGAQQIPPWGLPVEAPTSAAQSPQASRPSRDEPTLALPQGSRAPAGGVPPGPAGVGGRGGAAPSGSARGEEKGADSREPVFPPAPMERVVRRLAAESSDSSAALAMFAGLADASPALRAKQLSRILHAAAQGAGDEGRPIELGELLRSYLAADRRGLIHAYWRASSQGAKYQSLVRQSELLESLVPAAVERRKQPSGAREMLEVRARQLQTEADRTEAKARWLAARFELTERSGRPVESVWLVPVTLPHAGPYQLQLESQPPAVANAWPVRGLAASVPVHYESVRRRATAVVAADLARAEATAAYLRGSGRVETVLAAIEAYTCQTQAFLETVAQYNQAIADYALAVVPPTLPGEQLLRTLVVVK